MTHNSGRCTCPAQAEAIVDELEAKVIATAGNPSWATSAPEDHNADVPGSTEPPD